MTKVENESIDTFVFEKLFISSYSSLKKQMLIRNVYLNIIV